MSALGKTVIVTGGMSGIGAAVVEMLAQSDFIRVAIDIKPRADIQLRAPAVRWDQPFDVSDEAEVSAGAAEIEAAKVDAAILPLWNPSLAMTHTGK